MDSVGDARLNELPVNKCDPADSLARNSTNPSSAFVIVTVYVYRHTSALGVESVDYGVRVLAVNPGNTETDRQITRWKAQAKKDFGDENRWRELTTGFPLGRMAKVEEVAATIVFLCSDRSGYTSGTVVTVDGGLSWRK